MKNFRFKFYSVLISVQFEKELFQSISFNRLLVKYILKLKKKIIIVILDLISFLNEVQLDLF